MKLTQTEAINLLNEVGVPVVEIVTNPEDVTTRYNKDEWLTAIHTRCKKELKPQVEASLRIELQRAIAGKCAGAIRSIIVRKTGIRRADLEGLNEDQMIEVALTHYNSNFSKDLESLRTEFTTLNDYYTKAIKEQDTEWATKLKRIEDIFFERDFDALIKEVVKIVPRTGGNELKQFTLLKNYLKEECILYYDGVQKELMIIDKNNPTSFLHIDITARPVSDAAKTFFSELAITDKHDQKKY